MELRQHDLNSLTLSEGKQRINFFKSQFAKVKAFLYLIRCAFE